MLIPLRTFALVAFAAVAHVSAQSTTSATNNPASTPPATSNSGSIASTTAFTEVPTLVPVLTTRLISGSSTVQTLSSVATVVRVPLTSTQSSATTSATPSPTSQPSIHLDTRVTPTFGVLGCLLILTGLPTAFWGHKNRWSSFFLIGFYTLALTTIVLILKFGVLDAVNEPSKVVQGMFLLASVVAGVVGGGLSIFFWKHTKYFIGAWGGFALALWIQCFREGGLIRPVGFRWIFYVACSVVGFVLCTIPKIHYNVLLVSTAIVGASAMILGVDCFTTAGLKEFYIWNLGFMGLFPAFHDIRMPYPLYQTEQIELGLIAAVALMGGAVQFRMLGLLKKRLDEINEEQRKREEDAEIAAADRLGAFDEQMAHWEKRHGKSVSVPSAADIPTPTALTYDGRPSSQFSLLHSFGDAPPTPGGMPPTPGGMRAGDYAAVPVQSPKTAQPEPAAGGISGRRQSIGALPVLDLGTDDLAGGAGGVKRDSKARMQDTIQTNEQTEAQRRRQELVDEIEAIKRNIAQLKAEGASNTSASRSVSTTPLNSEPARSRTVSFDALRTPVHVQAPPESEWDKYVRERKLFTPPAGVTAPIPSGTINGRPMSAALPESVVEAVEARKRRESMLEMGQLVQDRTEPAIFSTAGSSSNSQGSRERPNRHSRHQSQGAPVILPPRKSTSASPGPGLTRPARVKTWEELQERHREKMRALQEPLRRAEAELAELENARSRWEKSRQVEKQVMERREAEQRAAYERKRRAGEESIAKKGANHRFSKLLGGSHPQPQAVENSGEEEVRDEAHQRPPRKHGRRDSAALKVSAWQAYQEQTAEPSPTRKSGESRRPRPTRHARQPSGHMRRDVPT